MRCSIQQLGVGLLSLWISGATQGATFTRTCEGQLAHRQQACTIKMTGRIESGDATALRNALRASPPSGWFIGTLLLDSPGGDVREALEVARIVRDALLATSNVDQDSDVSVAGARSFYACISACALIWFAGVDRDGYGGQNKTNGRFGIGLHRPYFVSDSYRQSPSVVADAQQNMTAQVREFLRREQVPEEFIQRMLERSSREIYWLDESGDRAALIGRAPWFEEMMIARCKFDPAYDREGEAAAVNVVTSKGQSVVTPEYKAYISWRRAYNSCEYRSRRNAQAEMRK